MGRDYSSLQMVAVIKSLPWILSLAPCSWPHSCSSYSLLSSTPAYPLSLWPLAVGHIHAAHTLFFRPHLPTLYLSGPLQLATFMQLITCGTLFYSTELIGHYDTGERTICVLLPLMCMYCSS